MEKHSLVSVITPTYNRPQYHQKLYECFSHQTYPHKKLLILDDTPEPSVFFKNLKDDRVRYIHVWQKLTIGALTVSYSNFFNEKNISGF